MFINWDKNPELTDEQLAEIVEALLLGIDATPLTAEIASVILAAYGL